MGAVSNGVSFLLFAIVMPTFGIASLVAPAVRRLAFEADRLQDLDCT